MSRARHWKVGSKNTSETCNTKTHPGKILTAREEKESRVLGKRSGGWHQGLAASSGYLSFIGGRVRSHEVFNRVLGPV